MKPANVFRIKAHRDERLIGQRVIFYCATGSGDKLYYLLDGVWPYLNKGGRYVFGEESNLEPVGEIDIDSINWEPLDL